MVVAVRGCRVSGNPPFDTGKSLRRPFRCLPDDALSGRTARAVNGSGRFVSFLSLDPRPQTVRQGARMRLIRLAARSPLREAVSPSPRGAAVPGVCGQAARRLSATLSRSPSSGSRPVPGVTISARGISARLNSTRVASPQEVARSLHLRTPPLHVTLSQIERPISLPAHEHPSAASPLRRRHPTGRRVPTRPSSFLPPCHNNEWSKVSAPSTNPATRLLATWCPTRARPFPILNT
jgi:hypothetical protein